MNKCVFCEENRFYYHKLSNMKFDDAIIYQDDNFDVTDNILVFIEDPEITIPQSVVSIVEDNITDTRLNNALCGQVNSLVSAVYE